MKSILIITCKSDVHADFVTIELRKSGCDVIRLNTEDFSHNIIFNCKYLKNEWIYDFFILDANLRFTSDDFNIVWYRKPKEIINLTVIDRHVADFVKEEYDYFLRSFYAINVNKTWVNPFMSNRNANQKLPNLKLASELGLTVPKTLITNDIDEASHFVNLCKSDILVKTFHYSGFVINETDIWHCFAKRLNKNDFEDYKDSIRLAPTFLQQYIEKELELRVTIIGSNVFTAAIHSQETEKAKDDWRAIDSYQIKHSIYTLPDNVSKCLLKFNSHYGLRFSTFDIILTPSGEYVFLECNPNGQWYWIEELTKMPMAKALADLMIELNK